MMRHVHKTLGKNFFLSLRYAVHSSRFWLAFIHSRRLKKVCFVGITGSAGKTTAKDLSANILRLAGECYSTPRSMNYSDGIAQLFFKIRPRHRFCVLELSGGNPGELDRPLRLFTPNIAVLTVIARDHFKAYKSLDSIAREKGKLISALPADGTAVLNIDDPLVRSIGANCDRKIIWVGKGEGATLKLLSARSRWPGSLILEVLYEGKVHQVNTCFHGKHLALSVLSALGVGIAAGISFTRAVSAVADVQPAEGRMEIVPVKNGITFLRDDWKAPHWSFSAPLVFMSEAEAKRKVIVIGTLSDYSLSASKLYPKIAREALGVGDIVVFVGPHAPRAIKAKRDTGIQNLYAFSDILEAGAFLKDTLAPGDLVLLKGSNKADHLVRLMYNMQKPVSCWLSQCGIQDFCGDCPKLYKPIPSRTEVSIFEQDSTLKASAVPLVGKDPGLKVIIGLGNPGAGYGSTPHNAGYRVLDRIATNAEAKWVSFPEGMICELDIAGKTVSLFKPAAKMNQSGPPTRQLLCRIGAAIDNCLVIHDEMDLALGQVRLKAGGGDAGHKGLKSLIASLGTFEIRRLRVGTRSVGDAGNAKASVLRPLSASNDATMELAIDKAVNILRDDVISSFATRHVPEETLSESV